MSTRVTCQHGGAGGTGKARAGRSKSRAKQQEAAETRGEATRSWRSEEGRKARGNGRRQSSQTKTKGKSEARQDEAAEQKKGKSEVTTCWIMSRFCLCLYSGRRWPFPGSARAHSGCVHNGYIALRAGPYLYRYIHIYVLILIGEAQIWSRKSPPIGNPGTRE